MHTDFSLQLCGVSSDTLVRVASGLSVQCVKKPCGLSTFASLESVRKGDAAMGQDCNYQLYITNCKKKCMKKYFSSIFLHLNYISFCIFHELNAVSLQIG